VTKLIQRLIYGYSQPDVSLQADRESILQLMAICIPVALVFTLVNMIYGFEQLAIILSSVALVLSLYWRMGHQRQTLFYAHEMLLINAFIVFGSLTWVGGIGNTGIYWSLCFPFLAFLIMGVRSGWYWIGFYALLLMICFTMALNGYITLPYEASVLLITPAMYLFFTLLACVLQLRNEKQTIQMQDLNRQLADSHQELREVNTGLEQEIWQRTSELQSSNTSLAKEVLEKEKALVHMRQSEEKFEHAQRMEAVGTLVGGIAHDFNNMLSGITANLYLVQREVESEKAQQRLAKIGDLILHAADMIRQLLTFARKDSVSLIQFDLRIFLHEAYKLAKVSIAEHIRCEQDFSGNNLVINGNVTQIQQILMNLMNNARDALTDAQNPVIRVTLRNFVPDAVFVQTHPQAKQQPYAVLSVVDNGNGIAPNVLPHIFEPFYTTKQAGKGTGLGLAMIYGAMQTHHGFIDVKSRVGEGTCFSLYFPLSNEAAGTASQQMQPVNGQGEMLLLVDDDKDLLQSNSALLIHLGYRVMVAANGMEAVRLYREHGETIALVLMDVVMPVLGGVAAAERIRALNRKAAIIFVTGYDRDHELTCELMPEGQMMLNKPLDVVLLSRTIADTIAAAAP